MTDKARTGHPRPVVSTLNKAHLSLWCAYSYSPSIICLAWVIQREQGPYLFDLSVLMSPWDINHILSATIQLKGASNSILTFGFFQLNSPSWFPHSRKINPHVLFTKRCTPKKSKFWSSNSLFVNRLTHFFKGGTIKLPWLHIVIYITCISMLVSTYVHIQTPWSTPLWYGLHIVIYITFISLFVSTYVHIQTPWLTRFCMDKTNNSRAT